MDNYTHVFRGDLDKAVDQLPDWHAPEQPQAKATGTDGQAALYAPVSARSRSKPEENSLAFCLALSDGKPRTSANSGELNATDVQGVANPHEHGKSLMDIGNFDKGRSGIRTHESRICNPLP